MGEGGEFGFPFLDAVFAEEALVGGVGFEDGIGGVGLADGHEGDGCGVAMGAGAGVCDLVAEAFEIGGDGGGWHGLGQVYRGAGCAIFVPQRWRLHPLASFPRPKG